MRAVAVAAGHAALRNRVRIRLARSGSLLRMACIADFGLAQTMHDRITGAVTDVTVCTGQLGRRMAFTVPAGISGMATETHAILSPDIGSRAGTETDDGRTFFTAPDPSRMIAARTMACFALQLAVTERTACVGRYRVHTAKQRQCDIVAMTHKARIGTIFAVVVLRRDGVSCRNPDRQHNGVAAQSLPADERRQPQSPVPVLASSARCARTSH